jgi:hypothetical protein
VFGEEPDLQLVASQDVTHEKVVGAVVTVGRGAGDRVAHLGNDSLVGLDEPREHGGHFLDAVGWPGDCGDFGNVAGIADGDTTERLDALGDEVDEFELLAGRRSPKFWISTPCWCSLGWLLRSRKTIQRGMTEGLSDDLTERPSGRVRAPGGGRKKAEIANPELAHALENLTEPDMHGDPESPLQWTTKSTRHLAATLTQMGHSVSHSVVAKLLRSLGYSLQGTRKKMEGSQRPDRDDQFRYINTLAREFLAPGDPVISVDTKEGTRRTVLSGRQRMVSTGRAGRCVNL